MSVLVRIYPKFNSGNHLFLHYFILSLLKIFKKTETTSCFGVIANLNTYLISYFRVGGCKNTIRVFLDQPHM